MKKKLFIVLFIGIFLLGNVLVMNVFGVEPSKIMVEEIKSTNFAEKYFSLPKDREVIGVLVMSCVFVFLMICSFVNRIKLTKIDKNDEEKIKKMKAKIEIQYVVGFLGILWCFLLLTSSTHYYGANVIHN